VHAQHVRARDLVSYVHVQVAWKTC
jgi:hypothetical protein